MDFTPFDTKRYPILRIAEGYGEGARSYEDRVLDLKLVVRSCPVFRGGVDEAELGCAGVGSPPNKHQAHPEELSAQSLPKDARLARK